MSVGNLPAQASVMIKIKYVTELQVEGELISFRLPGSVAPWKKDAAMKEITQVEIFFDKVNLIQSLAIKMKRIQFNQ